ncbi:MAG: hypothetical protein M5U14_16595 [Acidimicrobiia bacterium]|nr:hypothetical protein [Acidimicrobiia bacterium]
MVVSGEEPGERVGRTESLAGENVGGFAGRGEADHRTAGRGELLDGAGGGVGLAGPGRSDQQHERVVTGDGVSCGVLRIVAGLDRPGACGRPGLQEVLLVEHGPGRSAGP